MKKFITRFKEKIKGVLNGFDRIIFKGTLKHLSYEAGMANYLIDEGIPLSNFAGFVKKKSEQIRYHAEEIAKKANRPWIYLMSSNHRKIDLATEVADKDNIEKGLIGIWRIVEPCQSYDIRGFAKKGNYRLVKRQRKCLYLYYYWIDSRFGFMSAWIQTWYPFTVHVHVNGREWLAKQMSKEGIEYLKYRNCFIDISDFEKAQKLMNEQVNIDWAKALDNKAFGINPLLHELSEKYNINYYWTLDQSEWATDIVFKSEKDLKSIYPRLLSGAISTFSSEDVMRFLGKKLNGNYKGEIISDLKKRPEGFRIKHKAGKNSIKCYDKKNNLRVEATMNDATQFKIVDPEIKNEKGEVKYRKMRKGICDIKFRSEASQASNERYLDALASLDVDKSIKEIIDPICKPKIIKKRRARAIRPNSNEDSILLEIISRGELNINGFSNRMILPYLYGNVSEEERLKVSRRVTRKLWLLRAHNLIEKIPHSHRYLLTAKSREVIAAILNYRNISLRKLNQIAA
jgi:hypothetical protein